MRIFLKFDLISDYALQNIKMIFEQQITKFYNQTIDKNKKNVQKRVLNIYRTFILLIIIWYFLQMDLIYMTEITTTKTELLVDTTAIATITANRLPAATKFQHF